MRDNYWDLVKGVAIVLVVLGHAIQYGGGQEYLYSQAFWDNHVFKFIYGFHMPLFILVSGYLSYGTCSRKSTKDILVDKSIAILIPIVSFTVINMIVTHYNDISGLLSLEQWCYTYLNLLWYLWIYLICSILVSFIHKLDNIPAISFSILLSLSALFLPHRWIFHYLTWLFPIFMIGYFANRLKMMDHIKKHSIVLFTATACIYLFLIGFYTKDCFIYTTGTTILRNGAIDFNQLNIDIYREIIGILGTMMVLSGVAFAERYLSNRVVVWMGMSSLGIYCFQDLSFRIYFHLSRYLSQPDLMSWVVAILFFLFFSVSCTFFIQRNKYLSALLFAKFPSK